MLFWLNFWWLLKNSTKLLQNLWKFWKISGTRSPSRSIRSSMRTFRWSRRFCAGSLPGVFGNYFIVQSFFYFFQILNFVDKKEEEKEEIFFPQFPDAIPASRFLWKLKRSRTGFSFWKPSSITWYSTLFVKYYSTESLIKFDCIKEKNCSRIRQFSEHKSIIRVRKASV